MIHKTAVTEASNLDQSAVLRERDSQYNFLIWCGEGHPSLNHWNWPEVAMRTTNLVLDLLKPHLQWLEGKSIFPPKAIHSVSSLLGEHTCYRLYQRLLVIHLPFRHVLHSIGGGCSEERGCVPGVESVDFRCGGAVLHGVPPGPGQHPGLDQVVVALQ